MNSTGVSSHSDNFVEISATIDLSVKLPAILKKKTVISKMRSIRAEPSML